VSSAYPAILRQRHQRRWSGHHFADVNMTVRSVPRQSHLAQAAMSDSARMAKVKSKNTKPELAVRSAAHALGYRFRLHRPDLPGSPDLVFPRHRVALFVHGCFWHRHADCNRSSTPVAHRDYWVAKFERNVRRDSEAAAALRSTGWRVEVIWECETREGPALHAKIEAIFDDPTRRRRLGKPRQSS
jgi:DNA mismatch endonuclease (patch repair protein)